MHAEYQQKAPSGSMLVCRCTAM
uniref:Uncharacterized protein n=1 Tax=Arundo donax TaxID=35708 RepID=A0A0A9CID0_ARUDO